MWFIPLSLFALAYLSWRWSWRADLWVYAVARFALACLLLSWSAIWALALLVSGHGG